MRFWLEAREDLPKPKRDFNPVDLRELDDFLPLEREAEDVLFERDGVDLLDLVRALLELERDGEALDLALDWARDVEDFEPDFLAEDLAEEEDFFLVAVAIGMPFWLLKVNSRVQ